MGAPKDGAGLINEISIVATTYAPDGVEGEKRVQAFAEAVESWNEHLVFDGTINLIVADDGTDQWESSIQDIGLNDWKRGHSAGTRAIAQGVGGSLNRGFSQAFELSSIVLYAVDDWKLLHDFDIQPWVQLLDERQDVGVVRLGPPHPGNVLHAKPYTTNWQGWAARIDTHRSDGIVVSERPALWHQRMIQRFGWFKDRCSALECEAEYDVRYRSFSSPPLEVVLALPHPWYHLNPSELSDKDPNARRSLSSQS